MNIEETLEYLKAENPYDQFPEISITLGSGLGFFAKEALHKDKVIPYDQIPGFARSTVVGHAGNLIFGKVQGIPVVCMQGRFHFYEGHSMARIIYPLQCFARLGVKGVFLTNAAGGINPDFQPGNLMVINDHINMMGTNPLIGENDDRLGTRFPDMSTAWDPTLRKHLHDVAEEQGISLVEGVYLAVTGPSFETPAEIRAFASLGADAVGMSTVPECIAAVHAGMRVVGVSCITNVAAGLGDQPLSHEEVGETAAKVETVFSDLLSHFISKMMSELKVKT